MEAEAADFSILYIDYSFNPNLPSSIETKVVKLNIKLNKLNWTEPLSMHNVSLMHGDNFQRK